MRTLTFALPLLVAACAVHQSPPPPRPPVALIDSTGRPVGTVSAYETRGGVSLVVSASGLPHGIHGLHVHAVGRCDPPDFKSAGGHWNPMSHQHGSQNPAGPHMGDLPNVTVSSGGVLSETLVVPHAALSAPGAPGNLSDDDGSALVLHAGPDDYRTDPSGNSGARIACAVLAAPK